MHHTKDKADIGVAKVIADLVSKRHIPCIPLSEHQPYDLVAMLNNGSVAKLQVKYAALAENGTVEVRFRRNWADSKGAHTEHYNENEFDYYAIYCPEKDKVLYIPNAKDCPKAIRFDKPGNNQGKYVNWADNYLMI